MQSSAWPPTQKHIPSLTVNRGRPRQANAVYGVPSLLPSFFLQNFQDISHLRKRRPGATRGKPMQFSAWPPTEKHCIFNPEWRSLEASQCSLQSSLRLGTTLHLQLCTEATQGELMQSSAWPPTPEVHSCSIFCSSDRRTTSSVRPTSRSVIRPYKNCCSLPDELYGLHAMNS